MVNSPPPLGASVDDFLAGHAYALSGTNANPNISTFAELLAEFTASPSASAGVVSPDASALLLKSPKAAVIAANGLAASVAPARSNEQLDPESSPAARGNDRQREDSAVPPRMSEPNQHQGGQVNLLAQAIAGMDSTTQAHLLSALLARQQEHQQHAATTPSVVPPGFFHASAISNTQSLHNSPHSAQSFSTAASPNPAIAYSLPAHSHPPSLASSPLASPYLHGHGGQQQYFSSQVTHALPPTPLPPLPQPLLQQQQQQAFQNAFASPQAFGNLAAGQQAQQHASQVFSLTGAVGSDQNDAQWQARSGSATGGSYATTADTDFGENEFMFSPLMSPALTPHSTYSAASSLPPSASLYPSNQNLVTPVELFAALGSPALLPTGYHIDGGTGWAQQGARHSHHNSLQGLVDQTQALAFDPAQYQTMSPLLQATGSPSLVAVNAPTNGTSQGSAGGNGNGRRGASSSNRRTRPSPLLKPTPDAALRRKKTAAAAVVTDKRSSSVGSNAGARSATTSPFLGATHPAPLSSTWTSASMDSGTARSNAGSAKPSPEESAASGSSGVGINTPSPVDLDMSEVAAASSSSLRAMIHPHVEAHGSMAPPPAPAPSTTSSRRSSLQAAPEQTWMHPVTPASLMNFPADLSSAGLSLPLTSTSQMPSSSDVVNNGLHRSGSSSSSSHKIKRKAASQSQAGSPDASTSSLASSLTAAPAAFIAPTKIASRPLAPAPATEMSVAPGSKGKARAGSVSNGAAMPVRKIALKPAPRPLGQSQRIKPLLANGVASDALARLSTKSNYQNILDGRGVDLLGLDPTTVSVLNATQGGGADVRRTSHKAAEQKRRDSLKQCFEQLRRILPPIAPSLDEDKRPGEGNVGGQRSGSIDPDNPNRGVSKAALLRRSNEYLGMLHDRIERRDYAIETLRYKLRELQAQLDHFEPQEEEEVEGLDLDNIDRDEKEAGNTAFYELFESDEEEEIKPKAPSKRASVARLKTVQEPEAKLQTPGSARRSTRNVASAMDTDATEEEEATEMEIVP